jgi:hypothetical protein
MPMMDLTASERRQLKLLKATLYTSHTSQSTQGERGNESQFTNLVDTPPHRTQL